jgi:hypothetical protein
MASKNQNDWAMDANQMAKILSKLSCTLKSESWIKVHKKSTFDYEKRPQTAPACLKTSANHFSTAAWSRSRNKRMKSTSRTSSKGGRLNGNKVPYRELKQNYLKAKSFDYEREVLRAGNRPTSSFQRHRPISYTVNENERRKNNILRCQDLIF